MNKLHTADLITDVLLKNADINNELADNSIDDVLSSIRGHLGMEVAFIAEFVDGRREFQFVDSASDVCPVQVGNSDPLEESYCQRVVDGRLPELIRDALLEPAAQELPVTHELPVRSHLSVPIYLSNGDLYGTFCCFSSTDADNTLDNRDLAVMRSFAAFAATQIEKRLKIERKEKAKRSRILSVIQDKAFSIHYQPIFHIKKNKIIGFESLSRFTAEPYRTPDVWFNEAEEVGLGEQLELATMEIALEALMHLPENVYLAINSSPSNIISGAVGQILENAPLARIVLEVTEHAIVLDYAKLAAALNPLRERGLRFAVDDAGAGYASFRHILQLKPDIIKLDMGIIRDIDTDVNKQALAVAIIGFAKQIDIVIVAEGVETQSEMDTLRALQVSKVQGYFLGKPEEMSFAISLCQSAREKKLPMMNWLRRPLIPQKKNNPNHK